MSRRTKLADEDGFSLVELLVAMSIGIIVLIGVLAIVQATSRSSNRTTARIAADQAARPALTRIIDELHSSCISPDLAPILQGSGNSSVTFIYSADGGVSPVPQKKTITLDSSGLITEYTYAYSGGTAPDWTFSTTASPRQLVKNVTPAAAGGQTGLPLFRYYAYDSGGALSAVTPAAGGLSATEAAAVVQVTVALAVTPPKTTVSPDKAATLSLSDSALLRFSPASTTSGDNTPCA